MIKLATTSPKELIREVLRLPLKSLFWKGIRYRNLQKALILFTVLLAVQLRFSRRARNYAVRAILIMLFSGTFFGLLGTAALFGIKMRLHNKHHLSLQRANNKI